MEETKKCTRCGKELPLSAFVKNKSKKGGLGSWCKECNNKYDKKIFIVENPYAAQSLREDVMKTFNECKENITKEKRLLKYFDIECGSIALVPNLDEKNKEDTATYATKEDAKSACLLHREIAKQLNELANLMKNVPRYEFAAELNKLFFQSEDGAIQATPIDYDLFT